MTVKKRALEGIFQGHEKNLLSQTELDFHKWCYLYRLPQFFTGFCFFQR